MKIPMGPPPPKNPNPSDSDPNSSSSSSSSSSTQNQIDPQIDPSIAVPVKVPMGPPPPKNLSPPKPDSILVEETEKLTTNEQEQSNHQSGTHVAESEDMKVTNSGSDSASEEYSGVTVPYTIPPWSAPPSHPFFLEVLKDGAIIDQLNVSEKGAYMFGRVDLCDFVLEHPTISRFHAVLQFKQNGDSYLYDIGSTHGTFINKNQVKKKVYIELHVGDVIRFGHSSRLYVFQGPSELMPPEGDLEKIRSAKIREDMQDREASLLRAKMEASLADGISWGMAEDAIEEDEEVTEEITWQNHKGQLTERQEKTREKIIKRTQKIANMKKEIDAIRVKDIAQGGLTQGQQTQIARNEQRISQILEELESLEETLNDSIRESVGARAGKNRGKNKGDAEEEDEAVSDDDEFYDRTKKKLPSQRVGEHQAIETAESLLDKKEAILTEMEEKTNLLQKEKSRRSEKERENEAGDSLDAYMIGLSSQLELDGTMQLQKDLSALQSELDRILYLLKIADPAGEAAKRRELKEQAPKPVESNSNQPKLPNSGIKKQSSTEQKKNSRLNKLKEGLVEEEKPEAVKQPSEIPAVEKKVADGEESKIPVYSVTKPLWLGATQELDVKENKQQEAPLDIPHSDNFVDYKDRKKALSSVENKEVREESEIEKAAPGLIIRKRKQVEKPEGGDDKSLGILASSSVDTDSMAAESEAILLKHNLGQLPLDGNEQNESIEDGVHHRKEKAKSRRVLGPEKPAFLDSNQNYESWMPPEGQSGDGRTQLNDQYGY